MAWLLSGIVRPRRARDGGEDGDGSTTSSLRKILESVYGRRLRRHRSPGRHGPSSVRTEGGSGRGDAPERPAGGTEARPELLAWDPAEAAALEFPITEYQPRYFVAESLQDAKARMQEYCRRLARPFYARYNSATESIWVDRAVKRGD